MYPRRSRILYALSGSATILNATEFGARERRLLRDQRERCEGIYAELKANTTAAAGYKGKDAIICGLCNSSFPPGAHPDDGEIEEVMEYCAKCGEVRCWGGPCLTYCVDSHCSEAYCKTCQHEEMNRCAACNKFFCDDCCSSPPCNPDLMGRGCSEFDRDSQYCADCLDDHNCETFNNGY